MSSLAPHFTQQEAWWDGKVSRSHSKYEAEWESSSHPLLQSLYTKLPALHVRWRVLWEIEPCLKLHLGFRLTLRVNLTHSV